MRAWSRGFTLIELSVVGSCLTIAVGTAYGLSYELRAQQRVGEVDLRLAREAALVEEAWRHDARSADWAKVTPDTEVIRFGTVPEEVWWRVESGRLVRHDHGGDAVLCMDVVSASASRRGGLIALELTLAMALGDLERREVHQIVAAAPEAFR
jgi:hypothetical protein